MITDEAAKKNVAANLNKLRLEHGEPSYRAIAKATGESHTIVIKYFGGQVMPGGGALARLAEYFRVSTDFLLSAPQKRGRKQSA